jgi:hypothetical protein
VLDPIGSLRDTDAGDIPAHLAVNVMGVVDTDMQALIRRCPPERFPAVERFLEVARTQAFNSPTHVADHLLAIAFDPERWPDDYRQRVPDEAR